MNEYKANKQTTEWLKANGWDEKSFTVIELPFLQAQQVAYCLMKYHSALLDDEQTDILNNYLIDIKHKAKRQKITKNNVYRVLNIGTKINRQLFRKHRAINKGRYVTALTKDKNAGCNMTANDPALVIRSCK